MDFIKWEEKYSTGLEVIDEQHRQLFVLMNNFIGNFSQASRGEIRATLEALAEYAAYHFRSEEQFLAKHPELADHQREHAIFLKKIEGFHQAYDAQREDLSLALVQFLLSWLKNHILTTDLHTFREMWGVGV